MLKKAMLAALVLCGQSAFAGGVCGPNFESYVVTRGGWSASPEVFGIRCVAFHNESGQVGGPEVVWYGEGQWPGQSLYRHMGYAKWNGTALAATMADFAAYDNTNPAYRDSASHRLTLSQLPDGNTFQLIGSDINEKWYRSDAYYGYHPSGLSGSCGRNFQEYQVANLGAGAGSLRCLLRARDGTMIWYGEGNWSGRTYKHLGFYGSEGGATGLGMFDLCTPGTSFCAQGTGRSFGAVQLNYEACGGASCMHLLIPGNLEERWVTAGWVRHSFAPTPFAVPVARPGFNPGPSRRGGGVVVVPGTGMPIARPAVPVARPGFPN